VSDVLVVRGAATTDDLASLGLPVAQEFQQAQVVVLVPDVGQARVVRGSRRSLDGCLLSAAFIDVDGRLGRVAEVLDLVKRSYEQRYPRTAHLSHVHVGMFLFYWVTDEDEPRVVVDALSRGDLDAVRVAAERFVEADFGLDLPTREDGRLVGLHDADDGVRGTGAPRVESATDAVSGAAGTGVYGQADSD